MPWVKKSRFAALRLRTTSGSNAWPSSSRCSTGSSSIEPSATNSAWYGRHCGSLSGAYAAGAVEGLQPHAGDVEHLVEQRGARRLVLEERTTQVRAHHRVAADDPLEHEAEVGRDRVRRLIGRDVVERGAKRRDRRVVDRTHEPLLGPEVVHDEGGGGPRVLRDRPQRRALDPVRGEPPERGLADAGPAVRSSGSAAAMERLLAPVGQWLEQLVRNLTILT